MILATIVFDLVLIFLIGFVGATAKENKTIGVSLFVACILIMNVVCLWGLL